MKAVVDMKMVVWVLIPIFSANISLGLDYAVVPAPAHPNSCLSPQIVVHQAALSDIFAGQKKPGKTKRDQRRNDDPIITEIKESKTVALSMAEHERIITPIKNIFQQPSKELSSRTKKSSAISLSHEFDAAVKGGAIVLVTTPVPLFNLYLDDKGGKGGACAYFVDHGGQMGAKGMIYLSQVAASTLSPRQLAGLIAAALTERKEGNHSALQAQKVQIKIAPDTATVFAEHTAKDIADKKAAAQILGVLHLLAVVRESSIAYVSESRIVQRVCENLLNGLGLTNFSRKDMLAVFRQAVNGMHEDKIFNREGKQREWASKYAREAFTVLTFLWSSIQSIPDDSDLAWYYKFQRDFSGHVMRAKEWFPVAQERDIHRKWHVRASMGNDAEGTPDHVDIDEQGETELNSYQTLFDKVFRAKHRYVPMSRGEYRAVQSQESFQEKDLDAEEMATRLREYTRRGFVSDDDVEAILRALGKFQEAELGAPHGAMVLSGSYRGSRYALKLVHEILDKLISLREGDHKSIGPLSSNIDAMIQMIRFSRTPVELENALVLGYGILARGGMGSDMYGAQLYAAGAAAENLVEYELNIKHIIEFWKRKDELVLWNYPGDSAMCFTVLPKLRGRGATEFKTTLDQVFGYFTALTKKGHLSPHLGTGLLVAAMVGQNSTEYKEVFDFMLRVQSSGESSSVLKATKQVRDRTLTPIQKSAKKTLITYLDETIRNPDDREMSYPERFIEDIITYFLRLDRFAPADASLRIAGRFSPRDLLLIKRLIEKRLPKGRGMTFNLTNFARLSEKGIIDFQVNAISLMKIAESAQDFARGWELLDKRSPETQSKYARLDADQEEPRLKQWEYACALKVSRTVQEMSEAISLLEETRFAAVEWTGDDFSNLRPHFPSFILYELIQKLATEANDIPRIRDSYHMVRKRLFSVDHWKMNEVMKVVAFQVNTIDELESVTEELARIFQGVTDKDFESRLHKAEIADDYFIKSIFEAIRHYWNTSEMKNIVRSPKPSPVDPNFKLMPAGAESIEQAV